MAQWSRKDVYALLGRAEQGRLTPSDLENIDRLTDDDWTPLQVATSEGKERAVEALLEKKADVNKPRRKDGSTPVYIASENDQLACLDRLIAAGADVRQADQDGWTPVLIASQQGQLECSTASSPPVRTFVRQTRSA
eukprot:g36221.t1